MLHSYKTSTIWFCVEGDVSSHTQKGIVEVSFRRRAFAEFWRLTLRLLIGLSKDFHHEETSGGLICSDVEADLNLEAGWRAAPRALLAAWGARYAARGGIAFALLLGLFANFTVIGSVAPSGIVPFNFWIARSASMRWSNRMNPTPFDRPGTQPSPLFTPGTERAVVSRVVGASTASVKVLSRVTASMSRFFEQVIFF